MRTLIVAVMLLMFFSVGRAQEPLPVPVGPQEGAMAISQVQKLAPGDAGRFGTSIATNGNSAGAVMAVGAPITLVGNIINAGAVFIYQMDAGGTWQFWQKIVSPHPTEGYFGQAVDIAGTGIDTRIIVGAPFDDAIERDAGRAFVFRLDAQTWVLEAIIDDPNPGTSNSRDTFGTAVGISGSGDDMILAVSEPEAGPNAAITISAVHLFERNGTNWDYVTTVVPPDGFKFGSQLELVGWGDNTLLAVSGFPTSLYLYSRPQGEWKPEQKLTAYETGIGGEIAISGPPGHRIIALSGNSHTNNPIYVFRHNGAEWVPTQKLYASFYPLSLGYGASFGEQLTIAGTAENAVLFATLSAATTPQYRRLLRIHVTSQGSTLLDEILPTEAEKLEFARQLETFEDGSGSTVFAGGPLIGTGVVHILGNQAGVQVSPGAITVIEGSLGTSYVVSLSKAPTADVTITADPADGCDVGAGTGQPVTRTLTTANWNIPQAITVRAAPDNVPEAGSICLITHSAASTDAAYNGIAVSTVHASVYDPPMSPADIGLTDYDNVSIAEGGTSDSYSISLLSKPSSSVQVQALPNAQCDLGAGAGQAVTFDFSVAMWQTPATVTVIAADDALDEGTHTCLITHSVSGAAEYDGMSVPNVVALIADNDTPPVYLADITLTNHQNVAVIEGGANDSYSISLVYEPAYAVQIQAVPDAECDLGAGAGQAVTFDYSVAAWQTPAVVIVAAADDTFNEGTHTCVITHSVGGATEYAGMAVPNVTATITDNDAANLIANSGFESRVAPWIIKNKSGDKVLCDTATRSVAYAGSCAFRFKGSIGEKASLTQKINLSGVVFGQSDALRLQAMISGGAAAKGKLKLRVLYINGEDTVVKLALPVTGAYALTESTWLLLESPDVYSITVTIQHKSRKGKVWVDNVALWHRPVIVLRGVPEAVDGFRVP